VDNINEEKVSEMQPFDNSKYMNVQYRTR